MTTPFDEVITDIKKRGYHNHRLEDHSNIVSLGIFNDLLILCEELREDFKAKRINKWLNVRTPGARRRKIDMLVGEPLRERNKPNLEQLRICVENKSVITAHRNRDARFDVLNESLQVLHGVKPEAVLVATIIIGVGERVLNVPDKIKSMYKGRMAEFEGKVLPRLSSGDQKLWEDFQWAISYNRPTDPQKTVSKFQQLPRRAPGHTHVLGYDFVLLVPIYIDNVNPPYLARTNSLDIEIDKEYQAMLEQICKAYRARWHL